MNNVHSYVNIHMTVLSEIYTCQNMYICMHVSLYVCTHYSQGSYYVHSVHTYTHLYGRNLLNYKPISHNLRVVFQPFVIIHLIFTACHRSQCWFGFQSSSSMILVSCTVQTNLTSEMLRGCLLSAFVCFLKHQCRI